MLVFLGLFCHYEYDRLRKKSIHEIPPWLAKWFSCALVERYDEDDKQRI
jgi:hypothetical protein